jgi:hypothetical protein
MASCSRFDAREPRQTPLARGGYQTAQLDRQRDLLERDTHNTHLTQTEHTHTSKTEYEVDALALKAEEGRGDRRNVPGELHTSDEPGESEWGNPSRVMSGDRLPNP